MTQDIRWIQRFDNFQRALKQLERAFAIMEARELNELEQQGVIQAFEYNYELAWNVIKDFYQYQGVTDIQGSRDAFRLAFERGLIKDGEIWMDMIKKRQLTTHTYNRETSEKILTAIVDDYYYQFERLAEALEKQKADDLK
ncbi:nucleotidyltransferase substrate binding protein [Thalassolituus sp.]|uniref:nucleotidyltransferase substrate binding protein n=1 Tax=Thalassolituus sp. TaxID=2030822 RepID=UPI003512E698